MTNYSEVESIIQIVTKVFKKPITHEKRLLTIDLIDDWGMDSITFITLVIEIENAFQITIPNNYLSPESFSKINEILNIVRAVMTQPQIDIKDDTDE